jgi:hypothetical protein
LTDNHVRGLCWTVDPAFGRAVLRRVTVRLKLDLGVFAHTTQTSRVGLQIYRRDNAGPDAIPFLFSTFVPDCCRMSYGGSRQKARGTPFRTSACPTPCSI